MIFVTVPSNIECWRLKRVLRAGIVTSSFHGIGDIVTEQFEVRTVVSVAWGGGIALILKELAGKP